MCWWSENHQILFNSLELLAGLLYPDEIFTHSGMTGRDHSDHARPKVHRWLDSRARFGFSEWHSNVYFNEDMPSLVNLVDFADEEAIRIKAAMILDVLAFDMANNFYQGLFATTKGRTYPSRFVGGLSDSITEASWMMTNNVPINSINDLSPSHFTAAFLATSNYFPPEILERVAADTCDYHEHRQRDGITIEDGPTYGITYTDYEDIMFWWGMTGYVAPEIIEGTFDMVDYYELWDDFQWKDLALLQPIVGTPIVQGIASDLEYMFRGTVLEEVNTYTYRTPHYQLSGAQDWKPFHWTGQVVPWMGALSKECFVITAYPTILPPELGLAFGSEWTGGFVPRYTMNKNVAVIQYHLPALGNLAAYIPPGIDWNLLITDLPHAYFPRSAFDEYEERGNWLIGRKGDGYVALYTSTKGAWVNDYDILSTSSDNVYIVEMGDLENNGAFAEFVAAITSARIEITGHVEYDSPSQGTISVGWFGPMTVDGKEIDLGPFPRWENPYVYQEFGTMITTIAHGNEILILDFLTPKRQVFVR